VDGDDVARPYENVHFAGRGNMHQAIIDGKVQHDESIVVRVVYLGTLYLGEGVVQM
jgi:hypothetical protein